MKTFTLADAPALLAAGSPKVRRPNLLYFVQQDEAFACVDSKGATQYGQTGDYAAVDTITGNVFMIRASSSAANFLDVPATITIPT